MWVLPISSLKKTKYEIAIHIRKISSYFLGKNLMKDTSFKTN